MRRVSGAGEPPYKQEVSGPLPLLAERDTPPLQSLSLASTPEDGGPASPNAFSGHAAAGVQPRQDAAAAAAAASAPPTVSAKLVAAAFYASCSLLIVFVNKYALSVYAFPSFTSLALAQFVATVVLVRGLKAAGIVSFPDFDNTIWKRLFPLPIFFFLNVVTGLGGTKRINVAMFTVLRRFSILMTLILNYFILKRGSLFMTKVSVAMMILGAVVAAASDLTFDAVGFAMVLANDLFTAAVGVTLEKKLDAKDLNKWGLMFYNSLFSIPILAMALMYNTEEYNKVLTFPGWSNPSFIACFCLAASMGVVLQLSIFVCTQVNSALTTSVIGCLKNAVTAWLGMMGVGGGFVFSWPNAIGIQISIVGSLVYAYVELKNKASKQALAVATPTKERV